MSKRHSALVPLSRDHHHTLALALRLRQGEKALLTDGWSHDRKEQARRVQRLFRDDLTIHFRLEEEILFPAIQKHVQAASPLVTSLIDQHRKIEALVVRLRQTLSTNLDSLLSEIGAVLEEHIRAEERELFPMFEKDAPPEVAVEAAAAIHRSEHAWSETVVASGQYAGGKAILITEDEDEIRELLAMLLEADGFQVFTAGDGQSGLALVKDRPEEIGLLITDLGLPLLGGMELIQQARNVIPSLKIIAASGYGHMNVRGDLLKLGVTDFFPKPFSPPELVARAKQIVEEEQR
jgi:CheY-like chemotaxis protein